MCSNYRKYILPFFLSKINYIQVTTSSTRIGKFDARFFHMVFNEEFARVKGHFGPINSIQFHPTGRGYASGGEDGYVRVHQFDDAYFEFKFDY